MNSNKPARRRQSKAQPHTSDAFERFGCEEISYTLDIPAKQFDLKGLFDAAGIDPKSAHWTGILRAKNPYGAVGSWISRIGKHLTVAMLLQKSIEFSSFDVVSDIEEFNNSTNIVVEEVKP